MDLRWIPGVHASSLTCILLTVLLLLQPSFARTDQILESRRIPISEMRKIEKQCIKEKKSGNYKTEPAPACRQLQKIRELQSGGVSYRWNGAAKQYCYYDMAGNVLSCPQ